MLTARDRDRLVRVLRLLASDKDGERATAAWTASRMLRDRGLDWDSLIPRALAPPAASSQHQPRQSAALHAWSTKLAFILDRPHYLTQWELHFATDMQYRRKITPKQASVLARIYDRLASQDAG